VRLLLNEQISPRVATELRRNGHDVLSASELGTRGASDPEQLAAAVAAQRALVTYNIADFQALLIDRAHKGLPHWGIIFVSEKTISQRSFGSLVRALRRLLTHFPAKDALHNQALHLTKK
jgi:predicted nuclease of predicted toxin-antitoxin system